jgi:small-conductance mechanosensitive channel
MRIVIPVGVAYGSDVQVVLQILMDCAMASAGVSRTPEPLVMFKKFGDTALEFELHVWIHDIDERHKVRSALHQDLESRLRFAGITIAFPQRDIHIRKVENIDERQLNEFTRTESRKLAVETRRWAVRAQHPAAASRRATGCMV